MKKLSGRSILALGIVAVILVFLGYRGYCTFIREQNVFDQMYYSRVCKGSFEERRRLFKDMPQLRAGEDDGYIENIVGEYYDDDFLEKGQLIWLEFYRDDPSMVITYGVQTGNIYNNYIYIYDPDKRTLTYHSSDPENTEMKNFLFDRVLPDWFAANKGKTRFSSKNLGKYTFVDTTLEQEKTIHTTEVQFETYSIEEKQISFDDVFISYPVFVSDGSPFEETVNALLVERLCWGQDEEELKNYKGCQIFDNSYNITFANEDMVSFCLHIYAVQGGAHVIEEWLGVTFIISEQRFLRLSDICTWEDLVQCVGTPEDLLKRVPEEKIDQYVTDELPSEIGWDKEYDFYLGPDFVGLMLLNRATSSQENWTFEVPFDWTRKEYSFGAA